MPIKQNVHAFRIANRTYKLVSDFNKRFLDQMKDEDVETKIKMYAMCIRYMKETLDKKFK